MSRSPCLPAPPPPPPPLGAPLRRPPLHLGRTVAGVLHDPADRVHGDLDAPGAQLVADLARPEPWVLLPLPEDLLIALYLDLHRCGSARRGRPLARRRARHLVAPVVDREPAASVLLGRGAGALLRCHLQDLRTLAPPFPLPPPP